MKPILLAVMLVMAAAIPLHAQPKPAKHTHAVVRILQGVKTAAVYSVNGVKQVLRVPLFGAETVVDGARLVLTVAGKALGYCCQEGAGYVLYPVYLAVDKGAEYAAKADVALETFEQYVYGEHN